MNGKFYSICFARARKLPPIHFQLKMMSVRFLKFNLPPDWSYSPHLCPSKDLWRLCKELKNQGKWNQETFDNTYIPIFNNEMAQSAGAKRDFEFILWHLRNGHNVVFACYCDSPNMCHRSVIAQYVANHGYEVNYL